MSPEPRCVLTDLYTSQCGCPRCRPVVKNTGADADLYDLRGFRLRPGPYDFNSTSRMYHRPQCAHASRGERTVRWENDVPADRVRTDWDRERELFATGGHDARTVFCSTCVSEPI